jgi:hypothetical protein
MELFLQIIAGCYSKLVKEQENFIQPCPDLVTSEANFMKN